MRLAIIFHYFYFVLVNFLERICHIHGDVNVRLRLFENAGMRLFWLCRWERAGEEEEEKRPEETVIVAVLYLRIVCLLKSTVDEHTQEPNDII